MATYQQYSPSDVILTVNGAVVVGWENITVEMDEDKRSKFLGINGSGRHIKNLKESGNITIELQDYSPSNAQLALVDKLNVPVIISVIDKSTKGTSFVSDSCMLNKVPSLSRGAEGGTVEWVFGFISGEINLAGAKTA
jgi:hypothetical protein